MNMHRWKIVSLLVASAAFAACNTTTVKTTAQTPAVSQTAETIPESQLLDVGIGIFNPGIEALGENPENQTVFPEVRKAEARYFPDLLAATLQNTGGWGVVRIVPDRRSEMDVWVDGEILESDGEFLKVKVTVSDSTGKNWFTKTYEEEASKYAYEAASAQIGDPFQGLYNRVANDMLAYRMVMHPAEVDRVRTITELRFAQRFAPEAFSDYLAVDKQGRYAIMHLPADNDPLLERVRRIRERDGLFVDTLQDYYSSFSRQMEDPYRQWRKESYEESQLLRQTRAQSNARLLGGALAILGGIAAAVAGGSSDNVGVRSVGQVAGVVGVGAGAMLIKSGLDKRTEAKLHLEALRELSASLDAEVQPHTVTLEDRTVTLTGTVEQQYAQWRDILRQIYETETGANSAPQPTPAQ